MTYLFGFGLGNHILLPHILALIFSGITIFSFISGRLIRGKKIEGLYRFMNIAFGIAFYLFLGAVLLSLIFALTNIQPINATLVIGSLALLFGIYGLLEARTIAITEYEVALPGAPDSWHNKKALFISDTHFGLMNHKHFSNKLVQKILNLAPDFVIHGGDFYDGPEIPLEPITESWKELTKTMPVFYTSGNHEHYGNYDAFIASIKAAGITTLLNEHILYDGVQIGGITYLSKDKKEEAKALIEKLNLRPEIPSILINHPPTFHQVAEGVKVNVMLSGHTHRGQFSPIELITWLIYGKFNYGMHTVGEMVAITSKGVGTAGPPLRLFNKPELVMIQFLKR